MTDDDPKDFIAGQLHAQSGRVSIPLDTHPDHAAALGRLLGHWAFLEIQLTGVMECLLHVHGGVARVIWQQFISVKGKIELLQRLNWHGTENETLKSELDALLSEAQVLNSMRNKYIHALWADPGGTSNEMNRVSNTLAGNYKKIDMEYKSLTPAQIQDDVVKIAELSQSLSNWQGRFSASLYKPPL